MSKDELRAHFKKLACELSPAERQQASLRACGELEDLFNGDELVGSYSALQSELDLSSFNKAIEVKGALALPRVEGDKLVYYRVKNSPLELEKSSMGILEPKPSVCEPVAISDLSVILIPGLSFDSENYRLGYGKGFYDRLLAEHKPRLTIGITYKKLLSETPLPREAHDRQVHRTLVF